MAALSDARKLDLVFKALVGREETTTEKAWYEERPGHVTLLHTTEIWAEEIPETPPASDNGVIRPLIDWELTLDDTVANNRAWLVTKTPGDKTAPRYQLVHPRFGQGYTARIYDGSGTEIPTAHPVRWFLFYEAGVLIFEENPLSHGFSLPIRVKAYAYIGNTLDQALKAAGGKKWAMIMS